MSTLTKTLSPPKKASTVDHARASVDPCFEQRLIQGIRPIAEHYLALSLHHLFSTGIFDELVEEEQAVPIDLLAQTKQMDPHRLSGLLLFLANEGVVTVVDGAVALTAKGRQYGEFKGWYTMMIGGYTTTVQQIGQALSQGSPTCSREGRFVGLGSCEVSRFDGMPITRTLLSRANLDCRQMLDLGCGNGLYLVDFCRQIPNLTAWGVEPDRGGYEEALALIEKEGMGDRIQLHNSSTTEFLRNPRPDCNPDLIVFSFVLHEILAQEGEEALVKLLRKVVDRFPEINIVVIEVANEIDNPAIMRHGLARNFWNPYYLIHYFTQQRLEKQAFWDRLFEAAGLRVVDLITTDAAVDSTGLELGYLLRRNEDATSGASAHAPEQDAPWEGNCTLSSSLVDKIVAWATEQSLSTPVFCFSAYPLRAGVNRLREETGARISYATKANPHPLVLRELAGLVDEFNVTNLVDLDRLLAIDLEPHRLAWLHPVLTAETLKGVLARGVRRFVIDDQRGLDLLCSTGQELAVTLRLRPPDAGESERSLVRFGNSAGALQELAKGALASGLKVEALSFFVGVAGAGMGEARPYAAGIETLARLRAELLSHGITVPTINIGGGFPGSRRRFHLEYPDFFKRIRGMLQSAFGPDVDVLCEPGQYLVEPCMAMLTRVVADRVLNGRRLVYLEASAYGGLFETSFIAPGSRLTIGTPTQSGPPIPGELLGPIMDSFDVIQKNGRIPAMGEGDLLLLANAGAYSVGFSNQVEGIKAPDVVELPGELAEALGEEWYT